MAPKIGAVTNINNAILKIMEGESYKYLSIDTAEDDNGENLDVI